MIKNSITNKEQEFNEEIRINQLLQDNENYLRRRCRLPQVGLSWVDICEIVNPKNPQMAKVRLLDYLSKKELSLILVLILILSVFVGCSTNKAPDGISQEIYDEVVYIVKNIENEMEKQHYLDHKDIEKIKAYTSNYLLNEEHNLTDKEFELMQKLIHVTISTVDMKIASESKDEEKYKLHEREYKSNINEMKRIIKIK